jgi:choline dehydrogenase
VLASRLSEDPRRSVLLLEAGPDYPTVADLPPDIATSSLTARSHDWGYMSEPGILGRAVPLLRGRLVGGCSATNATAAVRGCPADYDTWADLLGEKSWSFEAVLPFFRRIEDDEDFGDSAWHGKGGPLPIRRTPLEELAPLQRAFRDACLVAGFPDVTDHNAPGAVGIGPWPSNGSRGLRRSAALTYLAAARARANLTMRSGAMVDRIVFEARRATGVALVGPSEIVHADRIVLAAGAYGSPALLLRSGVGPAEQLRSLGITVQADRPGVGHNLLDHPIVPLLVNAVDAQPPAPSPWTQMLLTCASEPGATGFDLHIFGGRGRDSADDYVLAVGLVTPRSSGHVRLRSADPMAAPMIDHGYLTHPNDLPRLITGVRLARRLARTTPLAQRIRSDPAPGPDTDATLAELVRARITTYFHPAGTCRMGPATEANAVVDARGKVHQADQLWVVDASVMPTIPAGNTNIPTLMIAERCAAWMTGEG